MTRNTIRRVEVAAPIYDEHVRERIVHIFNTMLADNVKARIMLPDSSYKYKQPKLGEELVDSQQSFIDESVANAAIAIQHSQQIAAKKTKPADPNAKHVKVKRRRSKKNRRARK